MKLLSVNVSLPKEVSYNGRAVSTGIFKQPVPGRVQLARLNLAGDAQADLTVHGGPDKAVYAYPSEHYAFWQRDLVRNDLSWGMFGENFTVEGLLEEQVRIGDRFRIGSAQTAVTAPRIPCYKLGIKFGDPGMPKRFLASRRTGFYLSVVEEGEVGAGDTIELLERDPQAITVADVTRIYAFEKDDWATIRRAADLEALPESWRGYFRKRLEKRTN
jgi:MOSC domain-containing protein YiiM